MGNLDESRRSLNRDGQAGAPLLIFLVGASGSGKTVVGRKVSEIIDWPLHDTDAMILAEANAARIADIFEYHGESYFREFEARCVDGLASIRSGAIVATGGGLPAIPGMMERLNNLGTCIYLKARLDTLWKRLCIDPKQLDDRPLLKESGKSGLRRLLKDREQTYSQAAITLDTDKLSVEEVCHLVATQVESLINRSPN